MHIAVQRERELLSRALANDESSDDKTLAKASLTDLEVMHIHRPALCVALQALAMRCPAYGPAVRLAKRW